MNDSEQWARARFAKFFMEELLVSAFKLKFHRDKLERIINKGTTTQEDGQ